VISGSSEHSKHLSSSYSVLLPGIYAELVDRMSKNNTAGDFEIYVVRNNVHCQYYLNFWHVSGFYRLSVGESYFYLCRWKCDAFNDL